ncbi:5-formyltetrahydrofolate cyclo-ligase [Agathobacter sp.]|uniref:5-formyltetrahydrofolate cyclo-ligase n=1 Tax=Agathobacter sp. TaxID=2021311 RepID=UPI003FD88699
METKKEIRSRLKKQRSLMGADECRSMSHEIYKRLIALELDREYDNILLYSAIRNEVNTDEYFACLINKAKRIYYPRVCGDEMSFYRVRSLAELNCGSFNINEPDMTHEYTEADGRALMIVPGLGFSDTGYRIGYGKGFYDRYLSSFTKRDTVMAVGVGYDFQLLGNVTFEDEYDVPLDGVITDKREVFIDD